MGGWVTDIYKTYTIYPYYRDQIMATKTLNIAIDEGLLKEIDKAVKKDMGSRSEYFRRLALADLERRNRWNGLFDSGRKLGAFLRSSYNEPRFLVLCE